MAFSFLLPIINVTTDSTWSQDFLDAFNKISSHTHTGGFNDADKINASSLLLTQDFSLGGLNAINARSYIMQNLSVDPSGVNDICSIYFKNNNFYANNAAGTHIQITNGSTINATSTIPAAFNYTSTSANFTLLNSDVYTYLAVNTSAARSIFLPAASTVPVGRFINIKDASGLSETNAITIVPNGADQIDGTAASYIVKKKYGTWLLTSNGSNQWYVSNYSNKELNDGTIKSNGSGLTLNGLGSGIVVTTSGSGTLALSAGTATQSLSTAGGISLSGSSYTLAASTISLTATGGLSLGTTYATITAPAVEFTGTDLNLSAGTATDFNISTFTSNRGISVNAKGIIINAALGAGYLRVGVGSSYTGEINGHLSLLPQFYTNTSTTLTQSSYKVQVMSTSAVTRTITLSNISWLEGTYFKIVNKTVSTVTITASSGTVDTLNSLQWCEIVYSFFTTPNWFTVAKGSL